MSVFRTMDLVQKTREPGVYVKGQWKEGAAKDIPFKGTAQPASGKVMELLPEGKRNSETITVFAPANLKFIPAEPELQQSGDIIVWEGRNYEVLIVRPWKCGIIPHWELVAVRAKEGKT